MRSYGNWIRTAEQQRDFPESFYISYLSGSLDSSFLFYLSSLDFLDSISTNFMFPLLSLSCLTQYSFLAGDYLSSGSKNLNQMWTAICRDVETCSAIVYTEDYYVQGLGRHWREWGLVWTGRSIDLGIFSSQRSLAVSCVCLESALSMHRRRKFLWRVDVVRTHDKVIASSESGMSGEGGFFVRFEWSGNEITSESSVSTQHYWMDFSIYTRTAFMNVLLLHVWNQSEHQPRRINSSAHLCSPRWALMRGNAC